MYRKPFFIITVILFLVALALLVTGSPLLTVSITDNTYIPLGNFITWVGFIALPASIYLGIGNLRQPKTKTDRLASRLIKALLLLSVLWVPICFLLSGNISFTFSEKAEFRGGQTAMKIFWYFNYFLAASPFVLVILYNIISYFKGLKNQPPLN